MKANPISGVRDRRERTGWLNPCQPGELGGRTCRDVGEGWRSDLLGRPRYGTPAWTNEGGVTHDLQVMKKSSDENFVLVDQVLGG